ncbi:MAG: flippase [Patescibacteria group bacterium]
MLKSIFKNASWLVVAELLNKGVFFLVTIIIARSFGTDLFGQFNYAISFVIIFSVIADFGINNLIIREVARDKDSADKLIGNSFILKIFLSILTIILIFISTIFTNKPAEVNLLVYVLSLYVVFNSYNTFSKSIYRAFEKMKFETLLKLIESIILVLYVIFASIYIKDMTVLIFGFVFASAVTFLMSIRWIKKFFTKFNFKFDKQTFLFLVKEGWPFALSGIFVTAYFNIDTVMVSWIKGDVETGWYSAAYNFLFISMLFPSLANASIYPVLSRQHKELHLLKRKINIWLLIQFATGIAMAIGIYFSAEWLISIVYGKEYLPGSSSLQVLGFVLPFAFLTNFLGVLLSSTNRQRTALYVTCFNVVINIGSNLWLIPRYGSIGAAYSALTSMFLSAIILLIIFKLKPTNYETSRPEGIR